MKSPNKVVERYARKLAPLTTDVRHEMKTLIAFLTFLIGLTILRCSASVIHVWISRTNGEDIITMNTPLSREELKTRFTTLAEIQPTAAIWIGVQPLVSANTVIDVIDILRQAGMKRLRLYKTHADGDIYIPLLIEEESSTTRQDNDKSNNAFQAIGTKVPQPER